MRIALLCLLAPLFIACGDDTTGSGGSPASGGAPEGGSPEGGSPQGGAPGGGAPEGGAPEGGAGGANTGTPCEVHCAFLDSLEVKLDCGYKGAGCAAACQTDVDSACGPDFVAYYGCQDEQPTADYACVEMTFTLQGGACDDEITAVMDCLGS